MTACLTLEAVDARLRSVERVLAGLNPRVRQLLGAAPVAAIVADAAALAGVAVADVLSDRRERDIARVRFAAIWVARNATDYTLQRIATRLGRDHTTIIYALRRADHLRAVDREFEALTDELLRLALERAQA